MLYHITPYQWEGIPEAYTAEIVTGSGSRKACFVCFLTKACFEPAGRLCLEGLHFKITEPEERPRYGDREARNGKWGVDCLESEEAREFYATGHIKVYEYHTDDQRERLFRHTLYAYQWREEYAEDLTQLEIAQRLEEIKQFEELEAAGAFPKNQIGTYNAIAEERRRRQCGNTL